jgi:hypothetical protein
MSGTQSRNRPMAVTVALRWPTNSSVQCCHGFTAGQENQLVSRIMFCVYSGRSLSVSGRRHGLECCAVVAIRSSATEQLDTREAPAHYMTHGRINPRELFNPQNLFNLPTKPKLDGGCGFVVAWSSIGSRDLGMHARACDSATVKN